MLKMTQERARIGGHRRPIFSKKTDKTSNQKKTVALFFPFTRIGSAAEHLAVINEHPETLIED